jgi:hypothetical protein
VSRAQFVEVAENGFRIDRVAVLAPPSLRHPFPEQLGLRDQHWCVGAEGQSAIERCDGECKRLAAVHEVPPAVDLRRFALQALEEDLAASRGFGAEQDRAA